MAPSEEGQTISQRMTNNPVIQGRFLLLSEEVGINK